MLYVRYGGGTLGGEVAGKRLVIKGTKLTRRRRRGFVNVLFFELAAVPLTGCGGTRVHAKTL